MKLPDQERRQADFPDIWKSIGTHDEAINTLKSNQLQVRQDFLGHKAETLSMFHSLKKEIIELVQPISNEVASIKDFIKKCTWVVVTATVIVGFIGTIIGFFIANFTQLSNMFHQHG
jgi:hypothetical protein